MMTCATTPGRVAVPDDGAGADDGSAHMCFHPGVPQVFPPPPPAVSSNERQMGLSSNAQRPEPLRTPPNPSGLARRILE